MSSSAVGQRVLINGLLLILKALMNNLLTINGRHPLQLPQKCRNKCTTFWCRPSKKHQLSQRKYLKIMHFHSGHEASTGRRNFDVMRERGWD